jgi:hypothetical protein
MTALLSADACSIGELFSLGRFQPASVQRNYQWDEARALRLLKSITAAMESSGAGKVDLEDTDVDQHLGDRPPEKAETIPLASDEPDEANKPDVELPAAAPAFYIGALVLQPVGQTKFDIYDGLQRLTTLTILMAVLRDFAEDKAIWRRLSEAIGDTAAMFRLSHVADDTLASRVQPPDSTRTYLKREHRPDSDTGRHVHDVKCRFYAMLRNRRKADRDALARFLLDNVFVSIVKVTNSRLAREIFVSSNLYQLPLQRDEIFKGQLVGLGRSRQEAERLRVLWDEMREVAGRKQSVSAEAVSDMHDSFGVRRDTSFERFLIAYDVIERRKLQRPDCLGDLIEHFEHLARRGELVERVEQMRAYADTWKRIEDSVESPTGGPIWSHVWRLGFQEWDDWRPLALLWLHKHETSGGRSIRWGADNTLWRMATLSRRAMAISLYQFGPHDRERAFLNAVMLASRSRPEEPFSTQGRSLPLDFSPKVRRKIMTDLSLPMEFDDQGRTRRTLLRWHEANLWDEAGQPPPGYIKGATVEHVLPERPALGSSWHSVFPDPEERYICYATIGNLALADREVNRELGDKPFGDKQDILARTAQYEKYRTLADVERTARWDPATVRARTVGLADAIWRELRLPTPVEPEPSPIQSA